MKRLLPTLLTLILLVTCICFLLPTEAHAASASDLTVKLNRDGQSYSVTGCKSSASGALEIPETYKGKPITAIGEEAFYYCYRLTSVTIPDSVTTIGASAFQYCTSLTGITIPDGVTTIGNYAFAHSSLTDVTIPDSVTIIGEDAFSFCMTLASVTIPSGVTTIGYNAFYKCDSLTSVTIPDSVTTIGASAFQYCSSLTQIVVDSNNPNYSSDGYGVLFNKDKTVLIQAPGAMSGIYTIPSGVTTIDASAFQHCSSLTGITIPDGVTTIDERAFNGCISLTSVTIGNSVTTIGEWAFYYCSSLTSVTIPDSVTTIGYMAFSRYSLEKLYFNGTKAQWISCNGGEEPAGIPVIFTYPYQAMLDGVECSIEDALANAKSGQTITLLIDCAADEVFLRMGRTLDLNGCTLTVEGEVAAANGSVQIKDSTNGEGILAVEKQHISINNLNTYLPVWVEGEGFHFVYHTMETRVWTLENRPTSGLHEDSVQFRFWINGAVNCFLANAWVNGAADNDIKVKVKMSWVNAAGFECEQYFTFKDATVKEYARIFDLNVMYVTIGGAKNVENLQITAVVVYGDAVELASAPHIAT